MTTFTTNLLLPKPGGTDAVDVGKDVGALADTIDSTLYPKVPYIARQTLGGSAASVTFASIPSTLRRLAIRYALLGDSAGAYTLFGRVNGDSATHYNWQNITAINTTVTASNSAATTSGLCGSVVGTGTGAGQWVSGVVEIVGWDSPHTGLAWTFTCEALGGSTANFVMQTGGTQYVTAGPYTSFTLFPSTGNFVTASDFQLEGWPT